NEINFEKISGYGCDEICKSAKEKIRVACDCPNAEIHFLVGGTQTNATVIDALLKRYETVITANTGHITEHEAGAIEAKGHKVTMLPSHEGKISCDDLLAFLKNYFDDENNAHIVRPGVVYISFPTEFGTIYSLDELKSLRKVCDEYNLKLYLDGARLGYGLSASSDVTLKDIAKYCHAFYIGGTKVGAMFGEAVVFTEENLVPHFFTLIKQNGALLAKGWLLGVQFDTLFTDDLYFKISDNAIKMAKRIEQAFVQKGYKIFIDSPTNQKFIVLENSKMQELKKSVSFSYWQKFDENHTVVRFATSWATTDEQVDELLRLI
ncbi:MAG: low specificity L-threonine aldolase, partial [Treponema sp.]|nr:low specificity L-threonine aldolase [Treponema sp.]